MSERLSPLAAELRSLHLGMDLLVLPNAWDAASARLVVEAGYPVVATSSGAISASLGYEDNDTMPVVEAFSALARVARAVDVPVTGDIEAGYRLPPPELVDSLLTAGAVGCNLEDTDHHGQEVLVPADRHSQWIAAVKQAGRAAGVDIVVNARVDVFLRHRAPVPELLDEAISRARLYRNAGADCVYPITLAGEEAIGAFCREVGGPVNILLRAGAPSLARLAELGVRRVSLAGSLFRLGMSAVKDRLEALRDDLPAHGR